MSSGMSKTTAPEVTMGRESTSPCQHARHTISGGSKDTCIVGITLHKHKIDIGGTILDGYETFYDVPVAKCLDFVYAVNACTHANK